MKTLNFLTLAMILLAGLTKAQTFQDNTPLSPVDGVTRLGACGGQTQPGVNMSKITIPNTITGNITDPSKITINLDISAAWLGDVAVELVTPSGEAITLIRRIGAIALTSCGDSSSFVAGNILGFNSANTSPIDAAAVGGGVAIPAGNYAPSYGTAKFPNHHPGVMSTFLTGKQVSGDWRLIIYDYGTGDPTTLNSWQMVIGAGVNLKTANVSGTFGSVISLKQNPVEDNLLIDVNTDFKTLNLEIYDASGKIVKKENVLRGAKDIRVPASELTPGMYLLVPIKDGEKIQPIKFIKK